MKPSASAPRRKATRLCKSHFPTLNPVMKQLMKRIILALLVCAGIAAGDPMLRAAEAAAKAPPPAPSLEQRVGSLEAYVNNGDPTAPLKDKDGKIPDGLVTPTSATSGPGHNAWQMTSAARVLFMTLPGLALFYGGLVRRKNVLSVMAQCLGCSALVTILWWLCGYSFTFASGSSVLGGVKYALLKGVGAAPNADYGAWVSQSVFA